MSQKIPGRLWESVGAYIFTINKTALSLYCKFPVVKQVEGFNADNLIKPARLSFQNTGYPVDSFIHRHKHYFTKV